MLTHQRRKKKFSSGLKKKFLRSVGLAPKQFYRKNKYAFMGAHRYHPAGTISTPTYRSNAATVAFMRKLYSNRFEKKARSQYLKRRFGQGARGSRLKNAYRSWNFRAKRGNY